ncbi:thiol-disulfide oxidoreductase DCC family protein [Streptomyces sulfonofaciens]|nr:DUF393 domain-containing protein [Streptomyces sulfonofaciens]
MRTRPVLVYDGDCGFCTTSVAFAGKRIRPDCDAGPWQFAELDALGVTRRRAEHELLWITPGGSVYGGARAVAKLLLSGGGAWPVLGAVLSVPPLRWLAHGLYRAVADHRHRMPGGTAACALPANRRPGAAGHR